MAKKEQPVAYPSLIGKNIYLRPATVEEIAEHYNWYLQSNPQSHSPRVVRLQPAKEAAETLCLGPCDSGGECLIITHTKENIPLGWLRFFNLNQHNNSVEFDILIDPEERRSGYASEAVGIICRYLFKTRGLNKISTTAVESNEPFIRLLLESGFQQDGTLRRHFFTNGEYQDGLLFSLLQFEFRS